MTRGRTDLGSSGAGRRSIPVARVSAAVTRQEAADTAHPPEAVTSLMGAIRLFAPLIAARKTHGFTDPQIVAMLAQHGIEISVETLRVYRGRLRREAGEVAGDEPRVAVPRAPAAREPTTLHRQERPVRDAAPPDPPPDGGREDRPDKFTRTITFDDGV